jgi:hypothetical protein
MTIEQTVEIPDNRRIYIDIPPQIPTGRVRIAINILDYPKTSTAIEAFNNEAEATEFATRLSKRLINETR